MVVAVLTGIHWVLEHSALSVAIKGVIDDIHTYTLLFVLVILGILTVLKVLIALVSSMLEEFHSLGGNKNKHRGKQYEEPTDKEVHLVWRDLLNFLGKRKDLTPSWLENRDYDAERKLAMNDFFGKQKT